MSRSGIRCAGFTAAILAAASCTSGLSATVGVSSPAVPAAAGPPTGSSGTTISLPFSPGPARTATPAPPGSAAVLVVRDLFTGGTCQYGVLVPRLVVYADGRVIRRGDSAGMYCDPVPTFTTGRVDLTAVRPVIEQYLGSPPARVDMAHPAGIADASGVQLEYTRTDGRSTTIAAVAVRERGSLDHQQQPPRAALAAVLARFDALTPTRRVWVPATVTITKTSAVPHDRPARRWPVTATPALRRLARGPANNCIQVGGQPARALLAAVAVRPAAWTWTVDGRPVPLVIGVVLDGFTPCPAGP